MTWMPHPPYKLTEISSAVRALCYSIYLNAHPEFWKR
jgi:hypothetical protein